MNMVRKGQMRGVEKGDILGQVAFIARLFGVAALAEQEVGLQPIVLPREFLLHSHVICAAFHSIIGIITA